MSVSTQHPSGIQLNDFGSYFVGGRIHAVTDAVTLRTPFSSEATIDRDPNGCYLIEQAYVQYFVPRNRRYRLPVLFIHGGGLTGSCWETTPDGRPGWLQFFLRSGFVCHVLDNAERGRAGFCPFPGIWPGAPIHRSLEEAWLLYRFGTNNQGLRPFEGTQFPTDAILQLLARHVPRWLQNEAVLMRNIDAAIEAIGPCLLIAHSQGGGLALRSTGSIRGCVVLEPHGVPEDAPQWPESTPVLSIFGDFLDPFWHARADKVERVFARWIKLGRKAENVRLPTRGMRGNSHMPMMDRNSDDVAALALQWLQASIALDTEESQLGMA